MRADNDGEGGILALMSLVRPSDKNTGWKYLLILTLGLFGASLLYGDGIITPAISVLSAVEGLNVATPFFEPYIIPLTVFILTALFAVQHKGTTGVGKIFGPATFIWFITIAVLGIGSIVKNTQVLNAINPYYAVEFFIANGFHGFVILGAVFLVVTGGEALYADMGHFGKKPIRFAWFVLVLPCLLLNYFGQEHCSWIMKRLLRIHFIILHLNGHAPGAIRTCRTPLWRASIAASSLACMPPVATPSWISFLD